MNGYACLNPAEQNGYVLVEEQEKQDGLPDTFPFFASQATPLGTENFEGVADIADGGGLCGSDDAIGELEYVECVVQQ